MVNLGICRKCQHCAVFSPAHINEEGTKTRHSFVECSFGAIKEVLEWKSSLPNECPYVLEQTITEESLFDLGEEEDDVA